MASHSDGDSKHYEYGLILRPILSTVKFSYLTFDSPSYLKIYKKLLKLSET